MPSAALRPTLVAIALSTTLAACGSDGTTNSASEVLATTAPTASAPLPEVVATTVAPVAAATTPAPAAASSEPMVDFLMPNFKGANLQDAQNKVQELGIFFSVSHDLRGTRNQVIDSNWQVCGQTPAAGKRIKGKAADYEGKIDFGVVKLTESCP